MATKPVILAVDDDLPVLRAVERDLRARYGEQYRIVAANSGAEALDAVRQLTLRGSTIALFMVDQRMPQMTGIEFLAQAVELQADARRVLLTAYADTDVAIRAINEIRLDHYILKPWDPPDEKLYPILDDLLSDWSATFRPAFEGVRLLAGRWAPGGHLIRDFLTRNQVPYAWLDPTDDAEGRRLAGVARGAGADRPGRAARPFADGSTLRDPSTHQIAEKVGLQTQARAAVLRRGDRRWRAGRPGSGGLRGQRGAQDDPGGVGGAGRAGGHHQPDRELPGIPGRTLRRRPGASRAGPGAAPRRRDPLAGPGDRHPARGPVPGRDASRRPATSRARRWWWRPGSATGSSRCRAPPSSPGAGIYYGAATTEAVLYRDQEVGVVGGGNSAGQAAVYLSRFAKRVLLMVRTPALSAMSQYLIDQIAACPNIEVRYETSVTAAHGEGHLAAVTVTGPAGDEELPLGGASSSSSASSRGPSGWRAPCCATRAASCSPATRCSRAGSRPPAGASPATPSCWNRACPASSWRGTCGIGPIKRIASAVGEGAMAVQFVHQYLAGL